MPLTAPTDLLFFAPQAARAMGESVAAALHVELSSSEEREYDGGEHKMRPLVAVQGRDVYVLHLLCGDAQASSNDRLMRLLFFIGALKDAGAARVTACVPYMPYSRKDRRTKASDPISTRYVASLFEAVGTDRVVVLDVHNLAAFENAFRIPTIPLDTATLFAHHLQGLTGSGDWAVASPDIGGVKRAQHLRDVLETTLKRPIGSAFMDKKRSDGVVSGDMLVGDVTGMRVMIVDDIISTGTTMSRAVAACRKAGASEVHVAATHAVLAPQARDLFTSERLAASDQLQGKPNSVLVTDSVTMRPEFKSYIGNELTVLNIAPLIATAIARLHNNESVTDLCGL